MPEQKQPKLNHDFAVLLAEIDGGKLRDELSQALSEALDLLESRALDTSSKAKGSLSLKLSIQVEKTGIVTIEGDVVSKLPKPLRSADHFYVHKGGLTRDNPRQLAFGGFRDVSSRRDEPAREAAAVNDRAAKEV